jgi:hypothetical protein
VLAGGAATSWGEAEVWRLANYRRLNYSRRCAEARIAVGSRDGDAVKWKVDPERDASEFDAGYYEELLKKAWYEVAFVLQQVP